MKKEHFVIPFLIMVFVSLLLYASYTENNKSKELIIPTIKINDCYIYQVKSQNPFRPFSKDTVSILDIKNGYILYVQNDGFVYSDDIKSFLNYVEKTDTCNCKPN